MLNAFARLRANFSWKPLIFAKRGLFGAGHDVIGELLLTGDHRDGVKRIIQIYIYKLDRMRNDNYSSISRFCWLPPYRKVSEKKVSVNEVYAEAEGTL